ncbi:hypothetical protein X971_0969 [Agrobacterium tumefaciens LBA4213 (Ach5)]|nr:hypothetical protein X971_0969 [Agrobacterium tumefaciens LBA4213 (Ach5)]
MTHQIWPRSQTCGIVDARAVVVSAPSPANAKGAFPKKDASAQSKIWTGFTPA